MRITFISNDTGGIDTLNVESGTTLAALLRQEGVDTKNYTVTVNRVKPASSNMELAQGDKVALTPKKVRGA